MALRTSCLFYFRYTIRFVALSFPELCTQPAPAKVPLAEEASDVSKPLPANVVSICLRLLNDRVSIRAPLYSTTNSPSSPPTIKKPPLARGDLGGLIPISQSESAEPLSTAKKKANRAKHVEHVRKSLSRSPAARPPPLLR